MKITRETYDRYSATEIRAFQLRERDGVEYAVVLDGETVPGMPNRVLKPVSEATGQDIEFDTTGKDDPS